MPLCSSPCCQLVNCMYRLVNHTYSFCHLINCGTRKDWPRLLRNNGSNFKCHAIYVTSKCGVKMNVVHGVQRLPFYGTLAENFAMAITYSHTTYGWQSSLWGVVLHWNYRQDFPQLFLLIKREDFSSNWEIFRIWQKIREISWKIGRLRSSGRDTCSQFKVGSSGNSWRRKCLRVFV